MKRKLMFQVCNSSAKTFALQLTKIDTAVSIVLAIAAGVSTYLFGSEVLTLRRALLALVAASCAYSSFMIIRALVPFVTHLSFAHMIRLRLAFYLWAGSLVAVAGLCSASQWFATLELTSVQLALALSSAVLTIRFFQSGSLLRLALAFCCAGGAFGISALGVLALVVTLSLMWFMSDRILTLDEISGWRDNPHRDVVEYFTNPLVRSRVKWVFVGCFLACGGLAFRLVLYCNGDVHDACHSWLYCIGLDGAVFLLTTAILPLVVGLNKAGRVSDVFERSDIGGLAVYMVIAPITALLMLNQILFRCLRSMTCTSNRSHWR